MPHNPENQNSIIMAWKSGELDTAQALEELTAYWIDQGGQDPGTAAASAQNVLDMEAAGGGAAGVGGGVSTPAVVGDEKPPEEELPDSSLGKGLGPIPGPAGTVGLSSQIIGPQNAFLNWAGLGGRSYLNPAERYQESFAPDVENLYGVASRQNLLGGGEGPASFEQYLKGLGGDVGDYAGRARGLLSNIFGYTPEQRAQGGFGYEPTYDVDTGEYGRGGVGELQGLLSAGLRGGYAPSAINWLVKNRLPREQDIWMQNQGKGAGSSPFLDYFRNQYNLKF